MLVDFQSHCLGGLFLGGSGRAKDDTGSLNKRGSAGSLLPNTGSTESWPKITSLSYACPAPSSQLTECMLKMKIKMALNFKVRVTATSRLGCYPS